MSFTDAVKSVFAQYAGFSGRARRSEYWWFTLFVVVVYIAASVVDAALGVTALTIVAILALLLPSIAVAVRRLHDTNRSGWWYLISLVPFVGGLILLAFTLQDSTPGPNRFGAPPKTAAVGYGYGTS